VKKINMWHFNARGLSNYLQESYN